jgi:hypothetical protein
MKPDLRISIKDYSRPPSLRRDKQQKSQGVAGADTELVDHSPSLNPLPKERAFTSAVSLNNLRWDWPDSYPQNQKCAIAVPSPRGRRSG